MFKRTRQVEKLERLNIVQIMDAVFIFIFFLLFSAQFIKLFEIETEAPVVSEVPEYVELEKDPLNLILKVYSNKIELLKGIDRIIDKTFYKKDVNYLILLKQELLKLRLSHPDDDYVIISPQPQIKYNEIIKIIDAAQTLPDKKIYKVKTKDKEKVLKKIFSQLVLEPMDET